uniref:Putative kunitz n=1 Tax=Ixodes ricinus TaxID=34613 RepID=A0A6B0V2R9_IXORI
MHWQLISEKLAPLLSRKFRLPKTPALGAVCLFAGGSWHRDRPRHPPSPVRNGAVLFEDRWSRCVYIGAKPFSFFTFSSVPAGHHGNATCSLPKKVGPCRAAMPRYYFDVTTGKCERFIYGGCEANANNFHTLKQCQRTCKEHGHSHHDCESPKDAGPCLAYIPRWFFNVDTSECEEFIYGGCQGNYNNYESLEQCQRICARA